jgi:hypothetical protein
VREIGGFRVLSKAPEAVLMVCAIAVLAVAMCVYANFDSDVPGAIPSEPKISYEIREPG